MTSVPFERPRAHDRSRGRVSVAVLLLGLFALLAAGCGSDEGASAEDLNLSLKQVAALEWPTAMGHQPGTERLYVTEQMGLVRLVDRESGELDPEPALDITEEINLPDTGGEPGLLGLAIHPEEPLIYLSFTQWHGENADGENLGYDRVIAEYAISDDGSVDPASRRDVFFFDKSRPHHNGGMIAFGPDGYLYAGFGDGTPVDDQKDAGQDPHSLFGTLVRVDPSPSGEAPYTIPQDNPFADGANGAPEVWAYGLRNPWRFSFDSETGDLWLPDVGEHTVEEINLLPSDEGAGRAANLGWSLFEGNIVRPPRDGSEPPEVEEPDDYVAPIHTYLVEDSDGCAIIGGKVYRGSEISGLGGAYLFGDYCDSAVYMSWWNGEELAVETALEVPANTLSFAEDTENEMYLILNDGLYRLVQE